MNNSINENGLVSCYLHFDMNQVSRTDLILISLYEKAEICFHKLYISTVKHLLILYDNLDEYTIHNDYL